MRVVSLVPSVTETLLAWGVSPVGVTRFCEAPGAEVVGGTKDPDVAAVAVLRPDLVVVCDEENRLDDAQSLAAAGLALEVLSVRAVADVVPALVRLAQCVGAAWRPDGGWRELDVAAPHGALRAFVPIWRRPWMTLSGDTYGSSLLGLAGASNVFGASPVRYPEVTLPEAAARRPDVVLAPSEPYPFGGRHRAELEQVAPVSFVDGRDLFWWGVRTPSALRRLRAAVGRLSGREAGRGGAGGPPRPDGRSA
ncbi:MAG: cobalamin-binding protein [Acidimicrobiales bacterium]|nr:cobalamin-binding protein [Acidimicrobiales bacterium]